MEHAEDERGPHLKVDWGIIDIRMLHDAVSSYIEKEDIDYDKQPYAKDNLEQMKKVLYSMILEFNFARLETDREKDI